METEATSPLEAIGQWINPETPPDQEVTRAELQRHRISTLIPFHLLIGGVVSVILFSLPIDDYQDVFRIAGVTILAVPFCLILSHFRRAQSAAYVGVFAIVGSALITLWDPTPISPIGAFVFLVVFPVFVAGTLLGPTSAIATGVLIGSTAVLHSALNLPGAIQGGFTDIALTTTLSAALSVLFAFYYQRQVDQLDTLRVAELAEQRRVVRKIS